MTQNQPVTSLSKTNHRPARHEECWEERIARSNQVGELGPFISSFARSYQAETNSPRSTYYYLLELNKLAEAHPCKGPADFTKLDLQQYVIERGEALAPRTRARIVSILRRFFEWCGEMELIESNPALALRRPKVAKPEPRFLENGAVRRLLAVADPSMQVFVGLAAYAGLRKGSIHALRWADVDLDAKTLTIRKAKGNKHLTVPMAPQLREILLVWKSMTRTNDSGYVFAHQRSGRWKPVYPSTSHKRFVKLAEAAGMPGVTAHDLRAHFATTLHKNGVEIAVISRLLGHSDISTTMNHYAFTTDRQKEVAIESLKY